MTRKWELTRDEAEYIVDVLEAVPEENQATGMFCLGQATANDLATELRELFGMCVSADRLDRLNARRLDLEEMVKRYKKG